MAPRDVVPLAGRAARQAGALPFQAVALLGQGRPGDGGENHGKTIGKHVKSVETWWKTMEKWLDFDGNSMESLWINYMECHIMSLWNVHRNIYDISLCDGHLNQPQETWTWDVHLTVLQADLDRTSWDLRCTNSLVIHHRPVSYNTYRTIPSWATPDSDASYIHISGVMRC